MRRESGCMLTGPRIQVLDDQTIGQIAAGEVIERPVSVVKELVENSLDAGATDVTVELREGGRREIIVIDNGIGMHRDELPLALARHGTSKLKSSADLFAIQTLGFRGEGLASIAAACGSLHIVSRPGGEEFGASIETSGGLDGRVRTVAAAPGTKVTVVDLFAPLPVRREFLKSEKAEFARISAFLSRLSLGWPSVGFRLRHDGRDVWYLPSVVNAIDRLEMVFGKGARGALLPLDGRSNQIRIGGFTSKLGQDRSNRLGQVLFVNGRLVRSAQMSAAWSAGYGSLIMGSRYPYGVILLSLPPDEVDVNVHPTKLEVRFRGEASVFHAVRQTVLTRLQESDPTRPLAANGSSSVSEPSFISNGVSLLEMPLLTVAQMQVEDLPNVRALGQIDRTFIMIEQPGGLIFLDQHAAHERIAYEALCKGEHPSAATEPLLFASIYELNPDQIATLHTYQTEFAAAGVEIEQFGDREYRILALPAMHGRRHFDLPAMLEDLAERPESSLHDVRHRVLATIACHSVVRAHEPLSLQEQMHLYERLLQCESPHTCPHGRPTMLHVDAHFLARAFKRL